MNEYNVSHLVAALDTMRNLYDGAKDMCAKGHADGTVKDNPAAQRLLDVAIECCSRVCDDLSFGRARMRLHGELIAYSRGGFITFGRLQQQIPEFLDDVNYDLMFRKFAYIEHEKAVKRGRFVGDWHPILERLPESAKDCVDGMDCYALGLYTAGVFHAMRIAEFGLRRLAKKLKVQIKNRGKAVPLEFGTWDTVIKAIKNEIDKTRLTSTTQKRDERLTFYSEMADHCEYMKDYWRNPASHTRKRYNEGECWGALERVRSFMFLIVADMETRK